MPNFVSAYFNRGVALRKKKMYEEAILDFSKVIELNPRHSLAYDNRSICKLKGKMDKVAACNDIKMAASLGLKSRIQWLNSPKGAWCKNLKK